MSIHAAHDEAFGNAVTNALAKLGHKELIGRSAPGFVPPSLPTPAPAPAPVTDTGDDDDIDIGAGILEPGDIYAGMT